MTGKLYCIGVGPGDPELLTLKAHRILSSVDVVAFPGDIAYQIASQAAPEIVKKPKLPLHFPMTTDPVVLQCAHHSAALAVKEVLVSGRSVAVLTLGDPAFYSSFSYLLEHFDDVEIVPGVTSFSAASARILQPLALGTESVRIITTVDNFDKTFIGTTVVLKAGKQLSVWHDLLAEREYWLIENCGMDGEKVFHNELPDTAGYFSLLIVR